MQEKETPPQKEFRSDRAFTDYSSFKTRNQHVPALAKSYFANHYTAFTQDFTSKWRHNCCSVDYAADLTQYYKSSLRI